MPRRSAVLVAAALALGAIAACGDDDADGTDATDSTTTTTSTPATSTTTSVPATTTTVADPECAPLPGQGTDPVEGGSDAEFAVLTEVVLRGDECVDRFVLRFRAPGGLGYHVRYADGPVAQCGSGETVDVAGEARLLVTVMPAGSFDFDTGEPAYTGPRELTGEGTTHVREAVVTCDFEADLTWVLGVEERRPFLVTADDGILTVEVA